MKNKQEILRYLIIGVCTTLISLITYYLCTKTFLSPINPFELQLANIIAWIVSVTFAYFTNHSFVFQSTHSITFKEITSFFLSRVATLLLDMFMMFLFVTILKMDDAISKLIVQVCVVILNYVFSKLFVFH